MPSQRGHMPPVMVKVLLSVLALPAPRSIVIAPPPRADGTLKENACGEPMCGCPIRLKRMRSIALASVAVPTVERALAPIRSWSTMIAVVSPASTSTSGRASVGMKPCTKALYVSLIIRCDSAAIVPNTSELLPEPETPVTTVSRRFAISTLTSLRLLTRAPCTRIKSWLSAACSVGDCVSVLVVLPIVSPSVTRSRLLLRGAAFAVSVGVAWLDLTSFEQYVWFSFVGVPAEPSARGRAARSPRAKRRCGAGRCGTSGTAWPAHAGRSRCARLTGHPLLRQRVDLEDLDFALDHGHVAGVAQPQPKDSGTRYGAPSAEAVPPRRLRRG